MEAYKDLEGWALMESNPRPLAYKKADLDLYLLDFIVLNSYAENVWPTGMGPARKIEDWPINIELITL
ncbi:MAG: hypothetical protein HOG34_04830 [Bacteroidetes bacterium]|jgi:hypothetical protein|nr:hypothetical protein [Bacteroidota bacterium]